MDNAHLLNLFATLAAEAGRDDLHDEFRRRASGINPQSPQPPQPPSPSSEADQFQKDGCRLIREGELDDAVTAFRKAIRLDPACADAHGNLGVAYAQQRKLPEAEAAFHLAIRFAPANVTMYANLATCLNQQKRHPEAEGWARQAIQLNPELPEPHRQLGSSLEARKLHEPAEAAFQEAARLDPRHADGQYRLGRVLARRDKPKEAEAAYRLAVKLKPNFPSAWSALAHFLSERDRQAEALDCAREAVKHDPQSADLHNSLGVAFAACERFADAEGEYREAVRIAPTLASAHSNLGNALRAQGRPDEAERAIREALRLKPTYAEAHNNLGIVLVQLGREDEGVRCYDEAIRLKPDYPEAHLNRSLTWLCNGDFARGWPEYEWRLKVKPFKHKATPGPRWDGSPLAGKALLITSEQGLGDSVHFIRYAPLAKARGATVLFDCPTPLASLLATCPGLDRAVPKGEKAVYDAHVPLLSLPGLFGVPPDAATAPVPYLRPDAGRVEHWRHELANVPGLRVGIAWQGSKVHKGDRLRSVPLTRFAPLAAVPGVSLLSVQKGAGSEQLTDGSANGMGVLDFGGKTAPEMADVAALMMGLDLVVAVDTAVVHLAGALGRPVWVAVPSAPDWRWLRDREDTPWYPTMRLFRQAHRGDWDGVFGRLAAALAGASRAKAEGRWDAHPLAAPGGQGMNTSGPAILTPADLPALGERLRAAGQVVVWTNGCFDLVHAGHVRSLRAARGFGDVLVVGVNADSSVRRLKGSGRPILPAGERAELIAALGCVGHVVVFEEDTPEACIRLLRPAVHCKGADYAPPGGKPIPEAPLVESYGGRVAFLPLVDGLSTTELVRRIRSLPPES